MMFNALAAAAIAAISLAAAPSYALSSTSSVILPSSIAVSIANSVEYEKWDSTRFFEEQDGGRLVRVSYSPDGKTASGVDIDGKKFLAQLQPEQTGPPIILAPIVLLGIGALVFSKSSEGQAIQAATLQQNGVAPTKVIK